MNFYIILALSAFLISLLGTRLTILARRGRIKPSLAVLRGDAPEPPPGGGGIVIVVALAIGLLMADVDYSIVLALFLLAAVSLLDELIGVAAPIKLLTQLVSVTIPLSTVHTAIWGGGLPLWLDKTLIAAAWIWFIRMFDRMDGMEGLAATEAVCVAGGLCLLSVMAGDLPKTLFSYSLVTATATVGFLWWNWHPAKILLGEVGCVPLGFLSGYLLLLAAAHGYTFAALILPAYAFADGAITALRRFGRHYYHEAANNGWRPDRVVRHVLGVNLLLVLLATLSTLCPPIALVILAVAYMSVFMLLGFFAHTAAETHHEG
ncbi:MAG: hypothetical protein KGI29_06915 [Pseudomonadota bacterium]|nr:hypothetical protein [Pseudomonadota bacterium]MDE3036854.1 hypothetical protein [Pseudomonadota bacterium]